MASDASQVLPDAFVWMPASTFAATSESVVVSGVSTLLHAENTTAARPAVANALQRTFVFMILFFRMFL